RQAENRLRQYLLSRQHRRPDALLPLRGRDPPHHRLRPRRQGSVAASRSDEECRNDRGAAQAPQEDAMKKLVVCLMLAAPCANAEELPIGAAAPKFSLVNAVDGKTMTFAPGKISVVVFTCNQCPYAKAFEPRL